MVASKDPPASKDVELLREPFKAIAKALLDDITAADLPMEVFETIRTIERQRVLFTKGVSWQPHLGPHCFGLAIDIVLAPKDKRWPKWGARPFRAVDGGGAPWDTGYDADARGAATLARQGVRDVVVKFGELVEARGLEWGGRWPETKFTGYPFGKDCFHCNLMGWKRAVREHQIVPREK